jgi:solute carrier family 25 (mitochondrial aspartate/glutamate transporter), member 12/13
MHASSWPTRRTLCQAFHKLGKDGDCYIEPEDFQRIVVQTSKHKPSDHILAL